MSKTDTNIDKNNKYAIMGMLIIFSIVPLVLFPVRNEMYFRGKLIVASIAVAIFVIMNYKQLTRSMKNHLFSGYTWIFILASLSVVSTLLSVNMRRSIIGTYLAPEGLIGYWICYGAFLIGMQIVLDDGILQSKKTEKLIEIILITASIITFISLIEFFGIIEPLSQMMKVRASLYTNFSTIGNRNIIGTYTVLILPISFWWTVYFRKYRGFIYTFLVVSLMVISQTRSAYLAFFLIMIGFVWITHKKASEKVWDIVLFLSIIAFIAGSLYILVNVLHDTRVLIRLEKLYMDLLNPLDDASGSDRIMIWRNTLQFVFDRPFFGFGPDTFGIVYSDYTGKITFSYPKAHNHWLHMLVTMGLPYLIIYIGFIVHLCYRLLRKGSELAKVILLVIIVYEFQGMFNISTGPNSYIYWLILGIGYNVTCRKN